MATTNGLVRDLEAFKATPSNVGYDLRLDLADIILRHVDGRRMTQRQLAERAGMKQSFITRIVHADSNCTFDVAGRLLFALGVTAKLIEEARFPAPPIRPNEFVTLPNTVTFESQGTINVHQKDQKVSSYYVAQQA